MAELFEEIELEDEKTRVRVNRMTEIRPKKVSVVHRGANRFVVITKAEDTMAEDTFGNIIVELDENGLPHERTVGEPPADQPDPAPAPAPAAQPEPTDKADVIAAPVQPKIMEAVTTAVEKLKSLIVRVRGMGETDEKVAKPIPSAIEQEIKSVATALSAVAEKYPAPKSGDEKADDTPAPTTTEPTVSTPDVSTAEPTDTAPATEPTEKAEKIQKPVKAKIVETATSAIERLLSLGNKVKGMQTSTEKLPRPIPASVEQALRTIASSLKGLLEKYPGTASQVAPGKDTDKPDDQPAGSPAQPADTELSVIERAAGEIEKAATAGGFDKAYIKSLRKIFNSTLKLMQEFDADTLKAMGVSIRRIKKADEEVAEYAAKLDTLQKEFDELKSTVTEQSDTIAKMDNPVPEARSSAHGWETVVDSAAQGRDNRRPVLWQPSTEKKT